MIKMLLGVDIGGTKCAVCLGKDDGTIIEKIKFPTTNVADTINNICRIAKDIQNKYPSVEACGVSCGGPLDENKGIIQSPPNLPGWDNIQIKKILEDLLGVPCAVRNDANACAVAEWHFGNGKGTKNMIFMTFGTGLGAGVIINGKLYSGTNGFAGELGHIRLACTGPVGYGKEGSFEGFCSGGGLSQLGRDCAQKAIAAGKTVPWYNGSLPDVKEMACAAREGDETALKVFETSGSMLGRGLAIVIDLLNPEKIIIGSIFARCGDLLTKHMYRILEREALPQALAKCEITTPALGEFIGDAAALAVAKEAIS
ncbi:MAG: ROK family protein [Clostridia bacterium]|nr:ROK family protein [Clostridia bacterium]